MQNITRSTEYRKYSYIDREDNHRSGLMAMNIIEIMTPFGIAFRFTKSDRGQTWVDSRNGKRVLWTFVQSEMRRFEKGIRH